MTETHAMLLYRAHELRQAVEDFLLDICKVRAAEAVGDYRRRVETIEELSFIVETDDFPSLIARLERYGGRTPLFASTRTSATFSLSSGVLLRIDRSHQGELGALADQVYRQQGTSPQTNRRHWRMGKRPKRGAVRVGNGILHEVQPILYRARTAGRL